MLPDFKPIALINEEGVISEGGVTSKTMKNIRSAINKVKTQDAKASNLLDKKKIEDFMGQNGCSYAMLDSTLRELSNVGLDNVSLRRRACFILFCMCPLASFLISNCLFWFAMTVRPDTRRWNHLCSFTDRVKEHVKSMCLR